MLARIGLTGCALVAFAGNSVLCRLALGSQLIDPASFTSVRLISGAVMLWLIIALRKTLGNSGKSANLNSDNSATTPRIHSNGKALQLLTPGAIALFLYAICFSYAYIALETATGALILFAVVQLTLITLGLLNGQRLQALEWLGLVIALGGFIYLLLPSAGRPEVTATCLMAFAGVAWGVYTWLGRSSKSPMRTTAVNFLLSIPLTLLTFAAAYFLLHNTSISLSGFWLAVTSGSLASGAGYAIWYSVLPALSAAQAGVLQLFVPVLAALGGVVFVGETLSLHLVTAGLITLAGIALLFWARYR